MKTVLSTMCAVLLGFTWTGSLIAAESTAAEIIVAMASPNTVCGGNTGKACPGTVTAPIPPVAASPVIPAPKPSLTPVTPTPPAPTPAPSTAPTTAVTTTPSGGPAGYTFCANENNTCNFSGQKTVAYGANGKFNSLNLTGGTACTNAVFSDPLVNTVKACYVKDVSGSTPAPTIPAPPPSAPAQASVKVSPSDAWCNAINKAAPGTDLILSPGSYTDPCSIKVSGKAGAPITIRSESSDSSKRAVLAYQGFSSNVMDLSGAFLTLRWLSFSPTQDSVDAIRIRSGSDIIIEQNTFTGIGGVSVAGNDSSLQRITVRDNTFKDLKYTVLYFGCQDGLACQASDIVVERNVIDGVTTPYDPSAVGYGIQIKLNSSATIRDNTIYRTKGPGIMVYGSNQGGPLSLLEGNYVEGSLEEGGIVVGGGPAIVRNNILVGNAYGGISAQDYSSRGLQKNIWIVHNTLLNNADSGINVQNWTGSSGNVIAFNAIAPTSGTPALRPANPTGTVTGNINCNPVSGCFDQPLRTPYSLWPLAGGPLMGAAGTGTEPWRPTDDFMGNARGSAADAGAMQKSSSQTAPLLGAGLARPSRNSSSSIPVTAIIAAPAPASHPLVTATLLGQTGEDLVGTISGTPDGVKDVHIKLNGVSGTIKGVRITGLEGIWETPANGKNWIVAIKPQADPSVVDLYFDYFKVISSYTITVTFSDGATQAFQASTNNPGSIYVAAPAPAPTAPATIASVPPTITPTNPATAPTTSVAPGAARSPLTTLAGDPQDGNGFDRAHWISSIKKMVTVFGGAGAQTPNGNNSLRAFDPVANAWSYVYPNNNGTAGLNNRDNYVSFYVPQRNELWIWGGSHLDGTCGAACLGARASGIFSFASNSWTLTHSIQNADASDWFLFCNSFSSLIKNCSNSSATMIDPGAAWSANANSGIIYGGSGYGGQNTYFLIEPNNLGGSQPYKMTEFKADSAGVVPPWRSQCMNCIVSDGKDFYLFGGFYQLPNDNNWYYRKDLWKFDTATKRWMQLGDAPTSGYASTLTYDSDLNSLVTWVGDNNVSHIYGYNISTAQWSDHTPAGLPCIINQVGVYSPTAKLHLFQGGNRCSDSGNPGTQVYAVSLSGNVPQQNVVTAASSALQAAIGFLDGIDASGNASGWSYDPDASTQSNDIKIYIDNTSTAIATITTSVSRPDVNNYKNVTGTHGFSYAIPGSYKDGKAHQLHAYGVDKTGNADTELSSSPQTFTLGTNQVAVTPAPVTVTPPPMAGSTCDGGLCLPLRTWVKRLLPPLGEGPCTQNQYGSCKEVRGAFRPIDGKIYYFGGDYSSISYYYGTLYTYDVLNDKWATEYPHAGIAGDTIMDNVADEIPWSYDAKRDLFYWFGGWGGGPNGSRGYGYTEGTLSPNGPLYVDPPLTYNPRTKKWTRGPGTTRFTEHESVYDPITDRIYMPNSDSMRIVNPADGSIVDAPMGPIASNGGVGFNSNNMQFDADIAGRVIYLLNISNIYGPWTYPTRFYTFNMDTHEIKELARPPQQTGMYFPLLAWDTVNKVLFWWTSWDFPQAYGYDPNLWIYHPDSNTWEKDALIQPEGLPVLGNSLVFDPQHNALVLMGSTENSGYYGHGQLDYLFIYRYGNGK